MFTYDLMDGLTRVIDRNGYATIYEYDANGNRTAVHYANGFTTTYDYGLLNRLIKQETVDIDGEIVVQYIYTLGVAGERRSVTELDRITPGREHQKYPQNRIVIVDNLFEIFDQLFDEWFDFDDE